MSNIELDIQTAQFDMRQDTTMHDQGLKTLRQDIVNEWAKLSKEHQGDADGGKALNSDWQKYLAGVNQGVHDNPEANKMLNGAEIIGADNDHIKTRERHIGSTVTAYTEDSSGNPIHVEAKDKHGITWDFKRIEGITPPIYELKRTGTKDNKSYTVTDLEVYAEGTVLFNVHGAAGANGKWAISPDGTIGPRS